MLPVKSHTVACVLPSGPVSDAEPSNAVHVDEPAGSTGHAAGDVGHADSQLGGTATLPRVRQHFLIPHLIC